MLAMLAALVGVVIMSGAPAVAHAEAPLYCDNYYFDNEGCQGPTEYLKYNESRNEEGGCIADQFYLVEGGGYTKVLEECGGQLAVIEITIYWTSFPKCWNRTNNFELIHCRRH